MEDLTQLSYSVDTLYFLLMGVLVMFMAPGFAMLEAGMVRSKNTTEILTKNVALFAIASIMYLLVGYAIMYPGAGEGSWASISVASVPSPRTKATRSSCRGNAPRRSAVSSRK